MSNYPRIWDTKNNFELKQTLDGGSSEDLNFARWHPKGNIVIYGGKDKNIWMFNAINGDFVSCCSGHEGEIQDA
jgi:WD40 repeat protein